MWPSPTLLFPPNSCFCEAPEICLHSIQQDNFLKQGYWPVTHSLQSLPSIVDASRLRVKHLLPSASFCKFFSWNFCPLAELYILCPSHVTGLPAASGTICTLAYLHNYAHQSGQPFPFLCFIIWGTPLHCLHWLPHKAFFNLMAIHQSVPPLGTCGTLVQTLQLNCNYLFSCWSLTSFGTMSYSPLCTWHPA